MSIVRVIRNSNPSWAAFPTELLSKESDLSDASFKLYLYILTYGSNDDFSEENARISLDWSRNKMKKSMKELNEKGLIFPDSEEKN